MKESEIFTLRDFGAALALMLLGFLVVFGGLRLILWLVRWVLHASI